MIITQTPLRIGLLGGGTDLPDYYREHGGRVLNCAIDKYIYVIVKQRFDDEIYVNYSKKEIVSKVDDLEHELVREAMLMTGVTKGVEITTLADIPSAGSGLGSSSSVTVGLLHALLAYQGHHASAEELAQRACEIEIERCGKPIGKQDQYIAAFGGLTCFQFDADDQVSVSPLRVSQQTLAELEERLLLFFTGYSRPASAILDDQRKRTEADDTAMIDNLEQTKALGLGIRNALEAGRPAEFGRLMHEHWEAKRRRSQGMSSGPIDAWYEKALNNGAVGGKLVGAGTGGFLMFYAQSPAELRTAMAAEGLQETRFSFDLDGTTVLVRD
jgi:D-glycero-alpha-D-manno-heptose-7-phosphate kinase